jgi:hypothetical protein
MIALSFALIYFLIGGIFALDFLDKNRDYQPRDLTVGVLLCLTIWPDLAVALVRGYLCQKHYVEKIKYLNKARGRKTTKKGRAR